MLHQPFAILFTDYNNENKNYISTYFGKQIMQIRHDGKGEYLTKGSKWSGNGAGQKSGERERSGEQRSQKTMERERRVAQRERMGVLKMP